MRKFTTEQVIENHSQKSSRELILVTVKGGLAEFVNNAPVTFDFQIIDFDQLENGCCPICSSDITAIKINGKLKEYCIDCDFWFD